MRAMIFSAGLGTRFKPWTDHHPKALAVVNGRSLLQRNIEYLQQAGIDKVVVNVHHFPEQIREAIEQNNGWGAQVEISDEENEVLETGGGLLKAKNLFNNEEAIVTINVDILTDLDLRSMISFHKEKQSLITLAVTQRKTSRYLLFDEEGKLCGWRNTSTDDEKLPVASSTLIEKAYSGIAVFDPEIFSLIPFTGKFSLIDVYLHLASTKRIFEYDHTGDKLLDVGKPESLAVAEALFN